MKISLYFKNCDLELDHEDDAGSQIVNFQTILVYLVATTIPSCFTPLISPTKDTKFGFLGSDFVLKPLARKAATVSFRGFPHSM